MTAVARQNGPLYKQAGVMAHTGSCLCGGVRFRIEGELGPVQVCHCTQCRKAQGGPFAAVIPVAASAYTDSKCGWWTIEGDALRYAQGHAA